jgi:hypothetical protein
MKRLLIFVGIVFVYIPLHFTLSQHITWYRSDVPDILASQITDACIEASTNNRRRRQSQVITFACNCIGAEVQKRYYLEEYLLMAGKIALNKATDGPEDQASIGGAKLADLQVHCIDETANQQSD